MTMHLTRTLLATLALSVSAMACGGVEGDDISPDLDSEDLSTTEAAATGVASECYVYIDPPCHLHPQVPSRTWIRDNYDGSPFNNGRCLLRAREFHQFCGLPAQGRVLAAFNLVGIGTISAQNVGGPGQVVYTYGWNWVELPARTNR